MSTEKLLDKVKKLREITGVGFKDCKSAIDENNGDIEKSIEFLRKKGIAKASKKMERVAADGLISINEENNNFSLIEINSETDFVAKNEDFINIANHILDKAIESDMSDSDNINDLVLEGGMTVAEKVLEQTGVIGEKIEVSAHIVEGVQVSSYVHAGNRLATLVGFNNKTDKQVAKDVAMQVAAMNPLSVDKDGIDQVTIDRELEIAKDLARQEGKPEEMLEKIAMGRLNKFYKENTLLNQGFIKESKKTVSQYLKEQNGELSVTCFKRIGLGN